MDVRQMFKWLYTTRVGIRFLVQKPFKVFSNFNIPTRGDNIAPQDRWCR